MSVHEFVLRYIFCAGGKSVGMEIGGKFTGERLTSTGDSPAISVVDNADSADMEDLLEFITY